MSLIGKLRGMKIARYLQAPPATRPAYNGEDWDLGKYGCPDCGDTKIYEGPSGGGAINNPFCRSAFWDGGFMGLRRISNTVFRAAFPACPEESEAYLKAEILKGLMAEDEVMLAKLQEERQ